MKKDFLAYLLLIVVVCIALLSCDSSTNSDQSSAQSSAGVPVAQLTVKESTFVPGRFELDGSGSRVEDGTGNLVSHTYTITDRGTGEIVYGPETVNEALNQARIKTHLSRGEYTASLKVEMNGSATAASGNQEGASRLLGESETDAETSDTETSQTLEVDFSSDADLSSGGGDCDLICSKSSDSDQVVCTLSSTADGCYSIDIKNDVMAAAAELNSDIDDSTNIWIQAFGASGGSGSTGCIFESGGSGGKGGFAQTITTVSDFYSTWGGTTIYYYLGSEGSNDSSGGAGGSSTIVSTIDPSDDNYLTTDDLVVLAGGGGGAGMGYCFGTGKSGGDAGFAFADETGPASASGSDGEGDFAGSGGNSDGDGGGGSGNGEDYVGLDGESGIGGQGGDSAGTTALGTSACQSGPSWVNQDPILDDDAGAGGNSGYCPSGGGGGGYGGGGGSGDTDGYYTCGGGGGGSYAPSSTTSDSDAPTEDDETGNSGDGYVVITFNP